MKYIIYDKYENAQALLCSAKELFTQLKLEVLTLNTPLADCGGYWARLVQKDDLIRNVAYKQMLLMRHLFFQKKMRMPMLFMLK